MFDFEEWLKEYQKAVERVFGGRIQFLGIQGSRARGEASPESDIDVVLILDHLEPEDVMAYRNAIAPLPKRGLICGFLSGWEELYAWTPAELFQFYYDTRPICGDLEFLRPMIGREAAVEAVRSGTCGIYHACVHNAVHERDVRILQDLYKSSIFTLQAKYFLETGCYLSRKSELLVSLKGEDLVVFQTGQALDEVSFDAASAVLLKWAGNTLVHLSDF